MLIRELGWGRIGLGLVLGLVVLGGNAVAQKQGAVDGFWGDEMCASCHTDTGIPRLDKYGEYKKHGHPWMEVATEGQAPGVDNFGFANLKDAEGISIGLPDPSKVFVANYLSDPKDSNKKKWAIIDQNSIPFTGSDGKFITAATSLSAAQTLIARRMTWSDVRALMGNFKENAANGDGAGDIVTSTGQYVASGGIWNQGGTYQNASLYTKRCFHCHNPSGFSSTPTADDDRSMYGISAAAWQNTLKDPKTNQIVATFPIGAPALGLFDQRIQGIQCEHCHGPEHTRAMPVGTFCVNCHSSTDPTDPSVDVNAFPNVDANGNATWDSKKRIPFAPTADLEDGVFTNHHGEGDEFRRSAHNKVVNKNGDKMGCVLCHDPHKSVWHAEGGIKYVGAHEDYATLEDYEKAAGNMCINCHQKTDHDADFPADQQPKKVRIRGIMGEIGLTCTDCHMPSKSEGVAGATTGGRFTHLVRINPDVVHAMDNVVSELTTPWGTAKANYWKSPDPNNPSNLTALDGDSFLTPDLVCSACHDNMTPEQMAIFAKGIHREDKLVDLTINNGDGLQILSKKNGAAGVAIGYSLKVAALDTPPTPGKPVTGNWFVLCQGPKGWTSWTGKTWKSGISPWKKKAPLADVDVPKFLTAKLTPGTYTYWLGVESLSDGSEDSYDSVPVYVSKK